MDDRWGVAEGPVQTIFEAAESIHGKLIRERELVQREGMGTGPGVSFGRTMVE